MSLTILTSVLLIAFYSLPTFSSPSPRYKFLELFVNGKGQGIVQVEGPEDSEVSPWDWLWFDGRSIHILKKSGSGGGQFRFEDPRFGKLMYNDDQTISYIDDSVEMKMIGFQFGKQSFDAFEYTCAKQNEIGKTFRFIPATTSEISDLQTKLDNNLVNLTFLPEHRKISWVLRDQNDAYYIFDSLQMGPPTAPIKNVFVGQKEILQKVQGVDHVMAMCGVDHEILFPDGSRISIFQPKAVRCRGSEKIQATLDIPGLEKQTLEILDPQTIDLKSFKFDESIYGEKPVLRTPCDLAFN